MARYISTWICIDSLEDATYFPSSKGLSSDLQVQNIYWKCVVTFFVSLQRYIDGENAVLFTNAKKLPEVEGINIKSLLEKLGVSIIYVEFNYKLPKGYFNSWTNQFFEFSILDQIAANFNDDDFFLMLDSDCIFLEKVDGLFKLCEEKECLTYLLESPKDEVINGISRLQMKGIYESLLQKNIDVVPEYHAGEFFMASVPIIKKFSFQFRTIWLKLLDLHQQGKPKLIEEAHVLSYIYFINGYAGGEANSFIKRIWTDPTNFRNATSEDNLLAIWHVPAEKKYGIEKLFQKFKKTNFNASQLDEFAYRKLIGRELTIPSIPVKRRLYYAAKKTAKSFIKLIKRT